MTRTDMEERLDNLDLRLPGIEQILTTLATKDDLAQVESSQRAFIESAFERMDTLFDGVHARLTGVETDTKGIQYAPDRLVQRLEARNVI